MIRYWPNHISAYRTEQVYSLDPTKQLFGYDRTESWYDLVKSLNSNLGLVTVE